MKRRNKPSVVEKPKFVLAIGRVYLVTRYYTGDFRGKCCDSLKRSAKFKVTDPMRSTLQVDDEIEVPFVHGEFLPAIVEDFKRASKDATYGG
jgi:hypothetical protein